MAPNWGSYEPHPETTGAVCPDERLYIFSSWTMPPVRSTMFGVTRSTRMMLSKTSYAELHLTFSSGFSKGDLGSSKNAPAKLTLENCPPVGHGGSRRPRCLATVH